MWIDSPILMTGGSDMAVVIEITITANNSAIVSNVGSVLALGRLWHRSRGFAAN